MKSKTKKRILILGIIAILVVALFLIINKNKNDISETPIEENDYCNSCTVTQNKDTITMSAYDYILSVMSEPQYWGLDNLPLYNLDYEQEYSYEKLTTQNGTGWILVDENDAVFYRGSEGLLTINFSNFTANIQTWANVYSSYENNTLDFDVTKYNFDYNNNHYEYIAPYGNTSGNHNYDYEIVLSSRTIRPKTEQEFKESNDLFDERFTVKQIILSYEELFEKAGCPLLNQPSGTLASYKNKTVMVEKPQSDGLIHAIWQQDNFTWQWDLSEEVIWLDSYQDIFDKDVESSELETVIYNGQEKKMAANSPLYLVLVNKENCTFQYIDKNPNTATVFLKLDEYFDAEAGAFASYFLMPMTKQIYGYNAVYFYDANKLPDSNGRYQLSFESKQDFLNNLKYPKDTSSSSILTVHKDGDIAIGLVGIEGDGCSTLNAMFLKIKQIAEYYDVDFMFGDDYMFNFYIYYNATAQRLLGLR